MTRTVRDIDDLPSRLRFALAIGVFDGVHRGHRRVVGALLAAAKRHEAQPVALTFDPHPAAVLHNQAPAQLCDPQERIALLHQLGVATVVMQRFDDAFADQTPEAFLERLRRGRELAALVMTPESAFGRDRAGTMATVRRLAPQLGFELVEVGQLASHGQTVSSTRLRAELAAGRLAEARRLLGRPYSVTGTVVRGDARGRELGYPTANLAFTEPVALPSDGVYAVRVRWGGKDVAEPHRSADGVASLGVRPTFGGGARILEAHLFDMNEDLYGVRMRVEFVRRLRGEKRFSSVAALVRQMDRDSVRSRSILRSNRTTVRLGGKET
ncbi:MAG: bifunctional riboflavin kinase/FAD synthetase [Chloroflexota bacterium]